MTSCKDILLTIWFNVPYLKEVSERKKAHFSDSFVIICKNWIKIKTNTSNEVYLLGSFLRNTSQTINQLFSTQYECYTATVCNIWLPLLSTYNHLKTRNFSCDVRLLALTYRALVDVHLFLSLAKSLVASP